MKYRCGDWTVQRLSTAVWSLVLAAGSLAGGLLTGSDSAQTRSAIVGLGVGCAILFAVVGLGSLLLWSRQYLHVDTEQGLLRAVSLRETIEFPAAETSARFPAKSSMLAPGNLELRRGNGDWIDVKAVAQGHQQQPAQMSALADDLAAMGIELEYI